MLASKVDARSPPLVILTITQTVYDIPCHQPTGTRTRAQAADASPGTRLYMAPPPWLCQACKAVNRILP